MSNVTNLDDYRDRNSLVDRICDEDAIDAFMAAFWTDSSFADLLDSPNLRRRTAIALAEVRDYVKGRDPAA